MPMSRVIIKVRVPVKPQTIMHGVITDHQFNPSNEPGASTLTVTGEDISLLMDLEQSNTPFPSQSDYDIVTQIVRKYGELGLELPSDGPPTEPRASNQPNPKEELQQSTVMATDRSFLQELAERYGFLFQVTPTAQGASRVHWGPPQRSTREQDPLLVNMGPSSNVESISFHNDAMRAEKVAFNQNQRRTTINEPGESRNIPFAQKRAEARRTVALTCGDPSRIKAIAQGKVDRASDRVITATGELDVLRYNKLLEPRRPVNVFGV
jgi:hypothetical protein